MKRRKNHWFHMFLVVVLAISPLRGAVAITAMSPASEHPQCAQMDTGHAGGHHHAAGAQQASAVTGNPCTLACDGSCCKTGCGTCAHGVHGITDHESLTPERHAIPRDHGVIAAFPQPSAIPPLRPPRS